jgi:16S rRNA (cytidine1402-2'-O)-methyltransferase
MPERSVLYVVATPIGNLRDISLRALDILASVDVVAAEHAHTSSHLLKSHSISTKIIALHQHNEVVVAERIIALLSAEKSVALISDAGTPSISDPGALLVNLVREQGYKVIPVPGANAALCALSAAGISNPHFLFYGFLPNKAGARKRELEMIKSLPHVLIFYEAPHRILECVADLIEIFGTQRQLTIARELTKIYETIHVCALGDALTWLQADSNQQRGEFVLLLSGAEAEKETTISDQTQHTLKILLEDLPLKQAVGLAVKITGENKKMLYKLALSWK